MGDAGGSGHQTAAVLIASLHASLPMASTVLRCRIMAHADPKPDARILDAQLMGDLWIFRAVGRGGSITNAASRLGVTQGAVSQRVSRLEARLAIILFGRSKGRMELTAQGAHLLATLDANAASLSTVLSEIGGREVTTLVVSCATTILAEWLAPRAEEYRLVRSGIDLRLRADDRLASRRWMEDEAIDLAVHVQVQDHDGLEPLGEFQDMIFPVCSPANARRWSAGEADQHSLTILHNDLPGGNRCAETDWQTWARLAGDQWNVAPQRERYFNVLQLAYRSAVAGEGVAMARSICVSRFLADGSLTIVPGTRPVPGCRYTVLAAQPGRVKSPVRQFAKWLIEQMAITQSRTLSNLDGFSPEPRSAA